MARIKLYHGTAHDFESFDDRFTMRGTEPNSALGIHLTESPHLAAEYARLAMRDRNAKEPIVLVVEAEVSKVGLVETREDFIGRPDDIPLEGTRTWSEFVQARFDLIDKGFDAIAAVELGADLEGAWVIFDPSKISILERLSLEAAKKIEDVDTFDADSHVNFESVDLHGDNADMVLDY